MEITLDDKHIAAKLVEICKEYNGGSAHFTNDPDIDATINDIVHYPHLFVLACLMDRQIKAERAWTIPYMVCKDLCKGDFSFNALEQLSLEDIAGYFHEQSLHRFNADMSELFYKAIVRIKVHYRGDASLIWAGNVSSAEVIYRFLCFDGCGIKIASMATNLLHRIFGKEYTDYSALDISPDIHIRRVLNRLGLVDDIDDVNMTIYRAKSIYPAFPGVLDECCWDVGRLYCHPTSPKCDECILNEICQYQNIKE